MPLLGERYSTRSLNCLRDRGIAGRRTPPALSHSAARVTRVAMRKGHQHSEHGKAGNQTKSSVADKRQRDSRHRQSAGHAADIDQRLKAYEGREPRRAELGKHITRINRSANASPDE